MRDDWVSGVEHAYEVTAGEKDAMAHAETVRELRVERVSMSQRPPLIEVKGTGHAAQAAPVAEDWPAGQLVQVGRPPPPTLFPAGHGVHDVDPAGE